MTNYRTERDSLGEVKVPADALYGPQTQRAIENFPVSGMRLPRVFIRSLGIIKAAAAEVNSDLGLLDKRISAAIVQAAGEVADSKWDAQFPVDIFQTGSGTSSNMNANEVISNRAMQILGNNSKQKVHPNDHVNMGQSSNDVIPAAIHLSACLQVHELLLPSLNHLKDVCEKRSAELASDIKTGRTHLMDAMPVTFGQEIGGWAYQIQEDTRRIESAQSGLFQLAVGGTAVGTGINTHPEFGKRTAARIAEHTGLPFRETANHFASQASMDNITEFSGQLKTIASGLLKIANDIRLMNSGPIAGFAEITLPALQPGSSIMPGKVNPVICEAMMMACAQVIGNDVAVTTGNSLGNFELNSMLPLIAHDTLQSITILGNACRLFADKVIAGFTVNTGRILENIGRNPILATALVSVIGYDKVAEIVKKANSEKISIKEAALVLTGLAPEELERLLNPEGMV